MMYELYCPYCHSLLVLANDRALQGMIVIECKECGKTIRFHGTCRSLGNSDFDDVLHDGSADYVVSDMRGYSGA